jgi:diguanylate cyclase (GGDEF)-like protein
MNPRLAEVNQMRVLIADDSLISRRLLEQTLRSWNYDVISASDGSEAWAILNGTTPPALAILDWMMPGLTGPEICRMVRSKGGEPYTYVLLLTSRNDKADVVEGLDSGADDYITKPFDRHELNVRLRAGTRIVQLQEQLLTTREALREQATRDYLTGIWNRSSILGVLDRELERSKRDGDPVGVVIADLDHFKGINDTYGHMTGDLALQQAARLMQESIRPYDSVGRYGGEEFLLVLPGLDDAHCQAQANRVRAAIRSTLLPFDRGQLSMSCSFGCTSGQGEYTTASELIRIADEALYIAKRSGRDRAIVLPSAVRPHHGCEHAPPEPVTSALPGIG